MSELLTGVKVLESAMLLNGSALGMNLADMGAEVIKLEAPGRGDYLRDFLGQITPHHSPAFMECNKNKRSLTVNLRRAEGRDIFFRLLAEADVFIDGFLPGACEAMGIGLEAQRAVNPRIIYCHYTGWGATGPWSSVPTHGGMMNALAGARPMEIADDGSIVPARAPDPYNGTASGGEATATGAAYMAAHVAAALLWRERTGRGCVLDGSGADAVIASGHIGAVTTLNFERIADRDRLPAMTTPELNSKYTYYRTKDDRIVLIALIEHKFWENFCRAVGAEDLLGQKDETKPVDWGYFPGLRERMQEIFASRTLAEWMDLAVRHDLAIGPANRVADLLTDPQIRSRQILVEGDHPGAGPFVYVGSPVIVEDQPYRLRRHSPELGEHTEEILTGIGYDAAAIRALRDAGVV